MYSSRCYKTIIFLLYSRVHVSVVRCAFWGGAEFRHCIAVSVNPYCPQHANIENKSLVYANMLIEKVLFFYQTTSSV